MPITLSKDALARLTPSVQRFFAEELETDLGEMKVSPVLSYVLKEVGPLIYNQAIRDAEQFIAQRVADLEAACYEKEFTYWSEKPKRK